MTIRLTHQVGNDQAGAVIEIDDRRASRLVSMGYAETITPKKVKESDARTKPGHRV